MFTYYIYFVQQVKAILNPVLFEALYAIRSISPI